MYLGCCCSTCPLTEGLPVKADQSQFVRTIELKHRSGPVIGTKEVVTYQGCGFRKF